MIVSRSPLTLIRLSRRIRRATLVLLTVALAACSVGATPAFAVTPWWQISSETAPTDLPPGGEGQLILLLSNLGDTRVNGANETVAFTDKLPPGLRATVISGPIKNGTKVECTLGSLHCVFGGVLNPYEQIAIAITVKAEEPAGTVSSLLDEASVEGGGARRVTRTQPVAISGQRMGFGIARYEQASFNEDGTPATQAGAHPFELTTTLAVNQAATRYPVQLPKDFQLNLPPGLVGNPTAVEQCSMADFFALVEVTNLCPVGSVVGVATVIAHEPKLKVFTRTVPVFNLVPSQGEPARLGFEVAGVVPIVIDTSVRSGRDYGVDASIENATETAGLLSSQVTLWGVPGDPRHDSARGWECVAGEEFVKQVGKPCPAASNLRQEPFLRMPTSCPSNPAAEPLRSSVEADSWAAPGNYLTSEYAWLSESGHGLSTENCAELPFTPQIGVMPGQSSASTPTGLTVDVKTPQKTTLEAGGLAEADVRDSTVTLPEGVQLSASAANGLEACSEQQAGFAGFNHSTEMAEFDTAEATCPNASKLGAVHIKTPLLAHELEGAVFLATPAPNGEPGRNPFGSLVALYIVARDPVSGVLVKLAGQGQVNEANQQISTTFSNTPEVPFEALTLELFGGSRASLTTPAACGAYPTEALFTPWSGAAPIGMSSDAEEFQVTSGPGGSPCPAGAPPFGPEFQAQSTNPAAGAYTDFQLALSRPDGDQALRSVAMHLPPGNAAMLSSVKQCSEAHADADACPAESLIGEATALAGLGPTPYVEHGGRVYLTGPYGGAPFGLEIVTPAVAGPFDLGTVTVRSKIFIDPNDASVSILSDPLPTQLRGIPLQLKRIQVLVDRPGFEFNPTNCSEMPIAATITGDQGASVPVSSPFAVAGCASLPFKPTLTASTKGQASKANGANFDVTVESEGLGQANIAKVRLQLPQALPARLTTLQKACTEGTFARNPASCPEGSVIGTATIHTPVLSSPLTGPAYLVSHGGAAFPDVEFVLQGEGITLVLDGKTQIKKQITYSKFESAPDAPFTVFETVLPAGPHSALTTNLPEKDKFNLCSAKLAMPTEIVGQNGAVIQQTTKIALQGCKKVAASRPLSRAQLLRRALAMCRKEHKHSKARRKACENHARRRYAAKKVSHQGAHRRGASHTKRRAP